MEDVGSIAVEWGVVYAVIATWIVMVVRVCVGVDERRGV